MGALLATGLLGEVEIEQLRKEMDTALLEIEQHREALEELALEQEQTEEAARIAREAHERLVNAGLVPRSLSAAATPRELLVWKPTRAERELIRKTAQGVAGRRSITLEPGIWRDQYDVYSWNHAELDGEGNGPDCDLFTHASWADFTKGVQLTLTGRAIVDFYIRPTGRGADDCDGLLGNVTVTYIHGSGIVLMDTFSGHLLQVRDNVVVGTVPRRLLHPADVVVSLKDAREARGGNASIEPAPRSLSAAATPQEAATLVAEYEQLAATPMHAEGGAHHRRVAREMRALLDAELLGEVELEQLAKEMDDARMEIEQHEEAVAAQARDPRSQVIRGGAAAKPTPRRAAATPPEALRTLHQTPLPELRDLATLAPIAALQDGLAATCLGVVVVLRGRPGNWSVLAGGRSLIAINPGVRHALEDALYRITDGRFATAEDLTLWRNDTEHWRAEQGAIAQRAQDPDGGVVY